MDETTLIELQRLFQLVHTHGLSELSITREGFSVSVSALSATAVPVGIAPVARPVISAPAPAAPVEVPAKPQGYAIASPLVGIFYRSASPDQPAFVEVGDTVQVGQTIGIVEAMKVFNEIVADRGGTVIAIPAENGKLVQVDQPLVILDK